MISDAGVDIHPSSLEMHLMKGLVSDDPQESLCKKHFLQVDSPLSDFRVNNKS